MHPSIDPKKSLNTLIHSVKNILNLTKKLLLLFLKELTLNSNNKKIYKVKALLYSKAAFKLPQPKRKIRIGNRQQHGNTIKESICIMHWKSRIGQRQGRSDNEIYAKEIIQQTMKTAKFKRNSSTLP